MADNTVLNSGSGGDTIASDDIAGVKYQRVKLTWGPDGTATDADTGASAIPIADGGNSITVDNAGLTELAAAINGSSQMDVNIAASSATLTVAAHAVTNAGTFAVQESGAALTALQLIDDPVSVLGTATYTEAASKGMLVGAVRRDADTTLVDTTNEIAPLQVDANGRLKVEAFSGETLPVSLTSTTITGTVAVTQSGTWDEVGINDSGNSITVDNNGTFAVQVDGAALTALQLIDDTVQVLGTDTYTEAASKGLTLGAVRRDADTTLVNTTNEFGPLQMDANGRLKVEAFSGETLPVSLTSTTITGTVAVTQSGTWDEVGINDSGNSITVDNGGTFVVQENGAALTALQLIDDAIVADDAAFTPATTKVMMAGFEYDDTTPDSVNEGDGGAARMSANRNQYVQIRDNAGNERGLNIDASGNATVNLAAGTNTNEVVGDAAHDAAIAGNPVRIAGRALTSDYTTVAAGDTADLITTLTGKLVTIPYANPANTWSYAAASGGITNTTGVTAKAAGGAGVRLYVTSAQIINGHATVSTDVQIRDGASGTVLWRGFAQAAGGGASVEFNPPLRGTANTLLEVACGTTGSATYFNLQGFSAAE